MDYVEVFRNLKTNNKYGRKSPHKAVMMLTVIELFEQNVLTNNEIYYDDSLKSMFKKVWNRVLFDEPLFHLDAYLPFWYLQNDSFWHIVPKRGKEDILSLMRDNNIKPSESKLNDSVRFAELDDDLYFLMTIPSGRSTLKRVLLETYTSLSEEQINKLSESSENSIDYSVSAFSAYEQILSQGKVKTKIDDIDVEDELIIQFQNLNEDIQIELNIQYYSFLKTHRNERDLFKEICPTVYVLFDKIAKHPIKQGDISPSFAFTYDIFLSDLKIALMSEEGSMELIEKVAEAIDTLRGNNNSEVKNIDSGENLGSNYSVPIVQIEEGKTKIQEETTIGEMEIEHVFGDSHEKIVERILTHSEGTKEIIATENRKGKPWTKEEEEIVKRYFNQSIDTSTIASIIGRTEVAIKARLAKMGLIDFIYGQEERTSVVDEENKKKTNESDFSIVNSLTTCYIKNKYGENVFSTEGKLKYINGKLYRLKLKKECFTLKSMHFDGSIWTKGEKKIVAYPQSSLYRMMDTAINYCEEVEDIFDSPVFENCKLKVKGIWFRYNGELVPAPQSQKENYEDDERKHHNLQSIKRHPLYAVRKQAILRAMSFFKSPAKIKDIARTISRTAWRTTIRENDVEDIINTISDVEAVDGGYILRNRN